jgi:hypothetical protein
VRRGTSSDAPLKCGRIEAMASRTLDVSEFFMCSHHEMKNQARLIIGAFLFIAIFLIGRYAFSETSGSLVSTIPEVGPHTPLLKVEKSENHQNLMVVYTKLDPQSCGFSAASGRPILDEYWLMDGAHYKKVNPIIKIAVRHRFELDRQAFKDKKKFLVHLKDFSELISDLGSSPIFEVKAEKKSGECRAIVEMKLGPSDEGRLISIESIYADSKKTLLPPFRQLKSLTLNGKDVATGEVIHRTYSAN